MRIPIWIVFCVYILEMAQGVRESSSIHYLKMEADIADDIENIPPKLIPQKAQTEGDRSSRKILGKTPFERGFSIISKECERNPIFRAGLMGAGYPTEDLRPSLAIWPVSFEDLQKRPKPLCYRKKTPKTKSLAELAEQLRILRERSNTW